MGVKCVGVWLRSEHDGNQGVELSFFHKVGCAGGVYDHQPSEWLDLDQGGETGVINEVVVINTTEYSMENSSSTSSSSGFYFLAQTCVWGTG